jgi:hypothetical protein
MIDEARYATKICTDYRLSRREFMDNVFSVVLLTPEELKEEPWNAEEFKRKF